MSRASVPEHYYKPPGGTFIRLINVQEGPNEDPEGGETQAIPGLGGVPVGTFADAEGLTVFSLTVTDFDNNEVDWRLQRENTKAGLLGKYKVKVGTARINYTDVYVQPIANEPSEGARTNAMKIVLKMMPPVPS